MNFAIVVCVGSTLIAVAGASSCSEQVLRRGSRGECVKVVQQAIGECYLIVNSATRHAVNRCACRWHFRANYRSGSARVSIEQPTHQ
jgi:hypothetical protein